VHCAERNGTKAATLASSFSSNQPRALNLHSAWDGTILRHDKGTTSDSVYAGALDARISAAQAAQWAQGTPRNWANESHQTGR